MSEKTEAPTPRRLSEARSEGRVVRSIELNAAAGLFIGLWLLGSAGGGLVGNMQGIMTDAVRAVRQVEPGGPWLVNLTLSYLLRLAPSLGIIIGGLLVTGVAVTVAQTGFLWAQKRIGFDFSRLNFFSGIKRVFSLQGLVELVKAILKLLVVGWVAYSFLRARSMEVLALSQMELGAALEQWVDMAQSLGMRVAAVYLVVACGDYAYQRWQHNRSIKMSKEEVKEDMKSSEGDPFIRSRIRGQQRRMARMRMMAKVPQADVVITNPTHLAVAIQYDANAMNAPKVIAKGADQVALRIKEIAQKHEIPLVENVTVARALYRTVEVEEEIPPDLYAALAEVLAYVYRLKGRAPLHG